MSDYFKDNPDEFLTGSIREIASEIDKEWWEDKKKKLEALSGSLDVELIELLPPDVRNEMLVSPEVYDEENPPEDSFLLKTFKKDEGKGFMVCCSNKIYKETKRVNKKEKEEIITILQKLSAQPTGSLLPKPHKLKQIGNAHLQNSLEKFFGTRVDNGYKGSTQGKTTFFQYRLGAEQKKRLVWVVDEVERVVRIVFYGKREKLNTAYKS